MPTNIVPVVVDVREVCKDYLTMRVQFKNMLWFKIGLLFLRFGCWLTGATFVDEFPMSLYQNIESADK